jgi:hypothetical protein
MSFFFGKGPKVKPQYTGMQTQTSTGSLPLPICYGQNRIAGNLIWYGDFKAVKHKESAKGGPKVTSYTYSASIMLSLCEGGVDGIAGIGKAWKDKEEKPDYTDYGFSLFTGTDPQSPWGYLVSAHPTEALNYAGVAYVAEANYDLGNANNIGNLNFEVKGLLNATQTGGAGDADPALMVQDFLTNDQYGVGFPADQLNTDALLSGPDAGTTGDSAYQTYCRAMGFGLSPALMSEDTGANILDHWTMLTNTAIVWTGYDLKLIPYGDEEVSANGVVYLPPTDVIYHLTSAAGDFIGDNSEDPVRGLRGDPVDAFNSIKMTIHDRANHYNERPLEWKDQNSIETIGLRTMETIDASEVCDGDMGTTMLSLIGQRKVYIRNKYTFSVPAIYVLIEPMDVLTLTDGSLSINVRVTDVEEQDDDLLQLTAEEYPGTVGGTGAYANQSNDNTTPNPGSDPGDINDPIIFEPPSDMTNGVAEVWAAVSGSGTYWGGAHVYVSTDDVTYTFIGDVDNPARMGVLTASLASYGGSNPDTGHTLAVNLTMSRGALLSTTSTEASRDGNLSYVDGEYISFETATLTSAYHYNLTNLYRALHGSTAGAHSSGTDFARLDDSIFKYQLPEDYIGQLLYFKFQSFNLWGLAEQDISTLTPYTYTPTGRGFGGGAAGVPTTPTGIAATASGSGIAVSWSANPSTDNVTSYQVFRAAGPGGLIGAATLQATVAGQSWVDLAVVAGSTYTYFVKAVNSVGASVASAGADGTASTTGSGPVILGFQRLTTGVVVSDVLASWDINPAYTLKAGLSGSKFVVGGETPVAPSADTTFSIEVNGVVVGSVTVANGAFTGTFTMAADHAVSSGTVVRIISPATLHGMTGVLTGSLAGVR